MELYSLEPLAQSEKGSVKNILNIQHKSYCTNDDFDFDGFSPKYQWTSILIRLPAYKPYHG